MKIPKYVSELLNGAEYVYNFRDYMYSDEGGKLENNDRLAAGYTIAIRKRLSVEYASTFQKNVERLAAWVNRQNGGECVIHYIPTKTRRKHSQYAILTIYDPIMQIIEKNNIRIK